MKNVWKIGMTYTHPELMIQNKLAYVFGDSMPTYLSNRDIGSVKVDDIVILAKSTQKGIERVGIVKTSPKYCLRENIKESDFIEAGITRSDNEVINSKFKEKEHYDVVYFSVDWLALDSSSIKAKFINTYGFTKVLNDINIINVVNNFLEMKKSIELLLSNKNLILTGAPGTGKTYLVKSIAKELILTPEILKNIDVNLFEPYKNQEINLQEQEDVLEAWKYWKKKILSTSFSIDDYANTLSNITDDEIKQKGGYLTCFLEWRSKFYGSSKPGTADNYGIKMNNDRKTYTVYGQPLDCTKQLAEKVFNEKIKSWLQELVSADFDEKITIIEKGHELVKASQLLKKIVILDHPDRLLSIYQDSTISNAFSYYLPGKKESSYFEQNSLLTAKLIEIFNIKRSNDNVLRLTSFIWRNFNMKSKISLNELKENYFQQYFMFVQFHPSFDYTDFVEGLRPIKKEGQDEIGFELRDGIFKEFCLSAIKTWEIDKDKKESEKKKYIFIIDEINRAEISKVFGELFFSIDPGYRGEDGKVKTQYSNLQDPDFCFFVPENVYLIGTMNDIDRSVESFDFAMRRRFAWKEITSEERKTMWEGKIDKWKEEAGVRMLRLNKSIEQIEGLGTSYHIGPAYFLKLQQYKGSFQKLWENHIGVLIKEYLRGTHNMIANYTKLKNAFNLIADSTDANK